MTTFKQLFQQKEAGITVYSPDCTQSRLWGNLDHKIYDETGFKPVYRQWINHRYATIVRFYGGETEEKDPIEIANKYETVPVEELQSGHMAIRLFCQVRHC